MTLESWLQSRAGLAGKKLQAAMKLCEENWADSVSELRRLATDEKQFEKAFPQAMLRSDILKALQATEDGEANAEDTNPDKGPTDTAAKPRRSEDSGTKAGQNLPEGKRYPFFASHKKSHTRFGDASADLARATKDIIKYKANLEGYFDADNLQNVSMEALSEGIVQSCSVLLFLNDETLDSKWVAHEVDEARAYGIPIICVVDVDRQTQREVIDKYMEKSFGWLFDAQVISFTTQNRDACIDLMITAIRRAVEYCCTHNTLTATTNSKKESKTKEGKVQTADVHESDIIDVAGLETQLKAAAVAVCGSARAVFDVHAKHGVVGKKEWRKLIKKVLPSLKQEQSKLLRKRLQNRMSWADFSAFFGHQSASSTNEGKMRDSEDKSEAASSGMATLPLEVPELPPSFRPRSDAQERLLAALLAREGARSTAVTAPKSRISSQGMGGVGKTMLTAAVVRDERVRASFETICWLNLSQQPEILQLQQRLHSQLTDDKMPSKAEGSVEFQREQLVKATAKRHILVVLDDMWDAEHERPFSCIDPATASKLLCTTRIKGIMPKGLEVELELLGVKESVELLAAVACIDADQTPPCCLEIAQLCGRLPLCLNIVGNLIRTFGGGWEDEIPSILKKDMKSLKTNKGDISQPLNLQQRVIQSGLDSLEGDDAADIVTLFKGMAVFAEDQIVPVAVLGVLWVGIAPKEHKALSAMKVRQWVSQLLSRSILLGSSTDGVSMHDIVRDFTLASQAGSGLEQLQRSFIATLVSGVSSKPFGNAANAAVSTYASSSLIHHLRGSLSPPFEDDDLAIVLFLHEAPSVVAQSLASVDRTDVDALAEHFLGSQDFWSASRLYNRLYSAAAGLSDESRIKYMLRTLKSLEHVDSRAQPEALDIEVAACYRFLLKYGSHKEVKRIATRLIEVAELDTKDSGVKGMKASGNARVAVGAMLLGQHKLHFSLTATDVAQARKGAALLIDGYAVKYTHADRASLPGGSFEKSFLLCCSQNSYAIYSITFLQLEQILGFLHAIPEGVAGLANQATDMYEAERDIPRSFARAGFDVFSGTGTCLVVAGVIVADILLAEAVLAKWLDGALWSFENQYFGFMILHAFPLVCMHDLSMLQRAFTSCGLSWNSDSTTPELVQMCLGRWRMEQDGKELLYNSPRTAVAMAKSLIAAYFPHRVEAAQVSTFLETAEAHTRDISQQVVTFGPSPSSVCSLCAHHLGDNVLAERFALAELASNLNPVKQQWLYTSLALEQCPQQQYEKNNKNKREGCA